MYRPNLTTIVDVDAEINAMAAYLATRWEHLGDVAKLLRSIYAVTLRDAPLWFDDYPLYELAAARRTHREQLLKAALAPAGDTLHLSSYDAPCQLLTWLPLNAKMVKRCAETLHGEWDFEDMTRAAYRALLAEYPELPQARPLGWEALRHGYIDFAGQEEYCENQQYEDEAAFEGINSAAAGVAGFTGRTALPYVMYDEVGQGRKAPYVLMSSAYAHFLAVISHNNTVALRAALAGVDLDESTEDLVFTLDFGPTGNALADTLLELTRAELGSAAELRQRYDSAVAAAAAQARLTEAERAAQKAEAAGRVADMLKSLRANRTDPEVEAREKQREAQCQARLRELAQLPAAN